MVALEIPDNFGTAVAIQTVPVKLQNSTYAAVLNSCTLLGDIERP